jgi:hypothetical protein
MGVAIGTVSLLLPWDSGFVWSGDTVVAQNAMNIFDLFAANDLAIVLGASLFVAGMLLFILNRWFVIFQFIGMMVLSFTMSSFVISKLPSLLDPYNNFRYETGLAIGYFLGWLSILILGTMLIDEKQKDITKKGKKQLPPSELVDSELAGQVGFNARDRPGFPPGHI